MCFVFGIMAFHHSLGRKAITTGLTFAPGDVSALCTHPGFTACGISCRTPQRPYLLPHPLGFRSGRAGHGQHGCAQVFSITVLTLSIYFIRAIAFPKTESLVKQYREAYESFLCPICEYSIRRGPPKFCVGTVGRLKSCRSRESRPVTKTIRLLQKSPDRERSVREGSFGILFAVSL
ncbi:MAG: hypothetical protein ACI9QL_001381 [Candidatus Omnitrophota bacterium]|jgi:hypothetical protein